MANKVGFWLGVVGLMMTVWACGGSRQNGLADAVDAATELASDQTAEVLPRLDNTAEVVGCPAGPSVIVGSVVALSPNSSSTVGPFPSDRYTVSDTSIRTGKRVSIKTGDNLLLDEALALLMPAPKMSQLLSRHDGFSLTGPILVPFSGKLDATSLVGDDGGVVGPSVFLVRLEADGTCDSRIPIKAEILEGQGPDKQMTVLVVRPKGVLEEARQYGLVVTHNVKGDDGLPVAADPQFQMPEQLDCLQLGSAPVCPRDVAVATLFTTGAPVMALQGIRSWLRQPDEGILDISFGEMGWARDVDFWPEGMTEFPASSVFVRGTFTAQDLRSADGDLGLVAGEPIEPSGTMKVPFVLLLPDKSVPGPWPIAILAHGLHGTKERVAYLAERFNAAGFALAAIDAPGHGDLADYGDLDTFEISALRGGYRQGHVNLLTFISVLEIAALSASLHYQGFQPLPDLDLSQGIAYIGESMGGIMGGAVCAVEPEISGVVLNVTGGGLSGFLLSYVEALVPANKKYLVRAAEALAQPLLDQVDPVAFSAQMRAKADRSLLLQAVVDDDTVSNTSTNLLAQALDVTQVCPCPIDVADIPKQEAPALLNALTYFADASHGFLLKNHSNPEATDKARRQAAHFLRTALGGQGEVTNP